MSNTPNSFIRRYGITAKLQQEGVDVVARGNVNFTGDAVDISDDPTNDASLVSISTVVARTIASTSTSITAGQAVMQKNGQLAIAKTASLPLGLTHAGIALDDGIAGETVHVVTQGLVDPTVVNVGAGVACAVGTDASGNPVRVTDPTCVSGLKYLGVCDASGAIYGSPRVAHFFDVTDFGAVGDSDGTTGNGTDDTTAIQAADAAAGAVGGVVFFPRGKYRTTAKLTQSHNTKWMGVGHESQVVGDHADFILEHAGTLNGSTAGNGKIDALHFISTTRTIGAVTGATNASPIEVTVVGHGLSTGDFVDLGSIGGNTAADGPWQITKTGADTFTLNGSTGSGAYTSGGTCTQVAKAGIHVLAVAFDSHTDTTVSGCFFGVVWDQAEVCSSYDYVGESNLIAQVYIANGDDFTPGAMATFSLSLSFLNWQLDGGQWGLIDDGGSYHFAAGGNINGQSVGSMRLADTSQSTFTTMDMESEPPLLTHTTFLKGTGIGSSSQLTFNKTLFGSSSSTNSLVIASAGYVDLIDCVFKGSGTKISGGYNAAALNIQRPIYTGTLLDNPPNEGAVGAEGGPETVLRTSGTAAPVSETYNYGAIVWNTTPTAGAYMGWVCVVAGSPGTWKGFGLIES